MSTHMLIYMRFGKLPVHLTELSLTQYHLLLPIPSFSYDIQMTCVYLVSNLFSCAIPVMCEIV